MQDQIDLSELGLDGKIQFADHIRAAIASMHRTYLTVMAALDSEDNWRPDGSTSMGRWVAARHAVTAGSGEELIRVAHRLEDLPAIGAAYGAGEPSWDQTRFLARFATPETDEVLAWRGARTSVNAFALEARRHEPVPEPKTENRFLDVRPDTTGYHLKGWLPGFDTKTWRAELPSGIQLGDETFRRLCCDARFEAIGRADGQLVTAAAPHRNIPRWLRRAAKRRDHGCRFPGCVHIRRIQLHHVVPCAVHGLTVLENLITLRRSRRPSSNPQAQARPSPGRAGTASGGRPERSGTVGVWVISSSRTCSRRWRPRCPNGWR